MPLADSKFDLLIGLIADWLIEDVEREGDFKGAGHGILTVSRPALHLNDSNQGDIHEPAEITTTP